VCAIEETRDWLIFVSKFCVISVGILILKLVDFGIFVFFKLFSDFYHFFYFLSILKRRLKRLFVHSKFFIIKILLKYNRVLELSTYS